jgi:hypothetical protein
LFQPAAQLPKTRRVAVDDLSCNGIRRGAVIGMAGEIAVLKHQHPDLALLDQAQTEGFAQGVPCEFVGVFKGFDQILLLAGPITSLSQASFQPVPDWVLLEASRS